MNANSQAELHRLEDSDTDATPRPRRTLRQAMDYHREQGDSWFIYDRNFYRMTRGKWQIESESVPETRRSVGREKRENRWGAKSNWGHKRRG